MSITATVDWFKKFKAFSKKESSEAARKNKKSSRRIRRKSENSKKIFIYYFLIFFLHLCTFGSFAQSLNLSISQSLNLSISQSRSPTHEVAFYFLWSTKTKKIAKSSVLRSLTALVSLPLTPSHAEHHTHTHTHTHTHSLQPEQLLS